MVMFPILVFEIIRVCILTKRFSAKGDQIQ